jgi:hypothetical protein
VVGIAVGAALVALAIAMPATSKTIENIIFDKCSGRNTLQWSMINC